MRHGAALLAFLATGALAAAATHGRSDRIRLLPQLHTGQSFDYLVSLQSDRDIKTQSSVIVPNLPDADRATVLGTLHVEVLARENTGFRLRTDLKPLSPVSGKARVETSPSSSPASPVEFTLDGGGSASQITGLDALTANQQAAWRDWLARFAASMTYPKGGMKLGDTWESEEREAVPSPIAGLVWRKKSQYVRDEPCPVARRTPQGDLTEAIRTAETCAVILTTATLKQKSSANDATPEDYKLNHLRTKGTATGKNETILYISRATGLLMRSSESAAQSMSVTISLAGGGNEVHYDVSARSHARIIFLQSAFLQSTPIPRP